MRDFGGAGLAMAGMFEHGDVDIIGVHVGVIAAARRGGGRSVCEIGGDAGGVDEVGKLSRGGAGVGSRLGFPDMMADEVDELPEDGEL